MSNGNNAQHPEFRLIQTLSVAGDLGFIRDQIAAGYDLGFEAQGGPTSVLIGHTDATPTTKPQPILLLTQLLTKRWA